MPIIGGENDWPVTSGTDPRPKISWQSPVVSHRNPTSSLIALRGAASRRRRVGLPREAGKQPGLLSSLIFADRNSILCDEGEK